MTLPTSWNKMMSLQTKGEWQSWIKSDWVPAWCEYPDWLSTRKCEYPFGFVLVTSSLHHHVINGAWLERVHDWRVQPSSSTKLEESHQALHYNASDEDHPPSVKHTYPFGFVLMTSSLHHHVIKGAWLERVHDWRVHDWIGCMIGHGAWLEGACLDLCFGFWLGACLDTCMSDHFLVVNQSHKIKLLANCNPSLYIACAKPLPLGLWLFWKQHRSDFGQAHFWRHPLANPFSWFLSVSMTKAVISCKRHGLTQ